MAERILPTRISEIMTELSSKVPLTPNVSLGRYDIYLGEGAKTVSITTPQGTILVLGINDIVQEREGRNSRKVVQRFTVANLPEGFSVRYS